jgi:hypothetical protein
MLALPVAVLILGSIGLSAQSTAPATAAVSRVHQLEVEDQSENPGNISAEEYYRHGDARRAEVRKLLEEGKLTSGEDFSDAALIFQHGQTPEEFLFAHVLAVEALIREGSADKWLPPRHSIAIFRRWISHKFFGTQYPGDKAAGNTPKPQVDPHVMNIQRTQQPYDAKLLPESVRQDFCVPDVSQQQKNLAIFNTGHRPEGKLMRATTCSH